MLITASQKNTRQAPRKVRLVANQVRKMPLEKALAQLAVIERRSSLVVLKTVRQAIANALNNHGLSLQDLTLKNITVTEGPRYRRFQAVSRGRAHSIIKRTSHVTVELEAPDAAASTVAASAKTEKAPAKKAEKTATTVTPTTQTQAPKTSELQKSAAVREKAARTTAAKASSKQVRSTARPKKGAK